MDGDQPVSEGRPSGVRAERAIRVTTVVAVATVAVVAAFVSYRHMRGVAIAHGEDAMTAAVLPFSVDGLIVAASMAMLADRRAGRNRSWLSYVLLALGACASLLANVLHAEPTFTARIIAGWPPLALLGSYELLMRQIHPAGRRSAGDPVTTVLPIPPQRGPTVTAATAAATATTAAATAAAVDWADIDRPAVASLPAGLDDVADRAAGLAAAVVPAARVADVGVADVAAGLGAVGDPPADLGAEVDLAAGLDGAADPAAKREAIARTLDQTGGSVTETVAVLAAQGITVSRSWVYQVRRNTPHADVNTGPSTRPTHRPSVRERRRGMASERTLVPTSGQ
ncbi:DUF2637 domain-containing protein [Frankia sp. AiPs1]|uniref:DUF2637 domain-containing protein n=1 Tax=Frankia sp. AiPs1 TaxID=573493 RepID=UPI0020439838|nr:DUF2637 domain-containing protein [Frankia sp. AiPs1]MCM3920814.1 DUF2637 domain-containing protein [Frankia sp. AiPs1]